MGHDPARAAGVPVWAADPDLLLGLRRSRAGDALLRGDPEEALIEAEELLDSHPDDVQALTIVGHAALELADPRMAALALDGVVRRRPDDAEAWAFLAMARTHMGALADALQAAQAALGVDDELALAWHLRGIVRDRLGQPGTDRDHARAAALDPQRFPLPTPITQATWDQALALARALLPLPARQFVGGLRLEWADLPPVDPPEEDEDGDSPLRAAEAVGLPPTQDGPDGVPTAIRIYRGNLAWPPTSVDGLAERIAAALTSVAYEWVEPDLVDG